jgi:uncharacterized protein
MTRLVRTYAADQLEVRSEARTIVGIAVPFDSETTIWESGRRYREVVRRGAFRRTLAERGPQRVKVLANHDERSWPIGRAQVLPEDHNGLYAELAVSRTRAGDEALELIRDGALDGLSIGFSPVAQDYQDDLCVRTEIALREISVVAFPAFDGARISAVRASMPPLRRDLARALQNEAYADLRIFL